MSRITSEEEIREVASNMIGYRLITKQTGAEGRPCNMVRRADNAVFLPHYFNPISFPAPPFFLQVQIVEAQNVAKEVYFAILMDRAAMVRAKESMHLRWLSLL